MDAHLPLLSIGKPGDGEKRYDKAVAKMNKEYSNRLERCEKKATDWRNNKQNALNATLKKDTKFEALETKADQLNDTKVAGNFTKPPDSKPGDKPIPAGGKYKAKPKVATVTTVFCCLPRTTYKPMIVYAWSAGQGRPITEWALIDGLPNRPEPMKNGKVYWTA